MIPSPVDFFDPRTRNWRARLAISIEVMRELSRVVSPADMESVFVRRMNQLFPTDRQLTITRRGLGRPDYRVTRFNLWIAPPDPRTHADRLPVHAGGLLSSLLYAEEPRVIDECQLDDGDPAVPYLISQQSLLAIPLFERGEATTMLVLGRDEPHAFPPDQVPDLVWLTNLFGRAMQTTVLSDALAVAYRQADYELKSVADMQRKLLPAAVPTIAGLDIAVEQRTAGRAGGDLYDFFPLDGGRLGVLVADVSGHGSPAAMILAILHTLAHHSPIPPDRPGAFLTALNERLTARYTATTGTFVTAFFAVVDPAAGSMTYASAGHVPPRLVRADGRDGVALNRAQRLPLGINPKAASYPEASVTFAPGDTVAIVTDGITEATDPRGDCFGLERIDAALVLAAGNAGHRLAAVRIALDAFSGADSPKDDQTVVVIRRP